MPQTDLDALRKLHEEIEDDYSEDFGQPILDAIHELERLRVEVALWRRGQQPLFPGDEAQRSKDAALRRFNEKDPAR